MKKDTASTGATRTEFTVMSGKHGLFTHTSEDAARHFLAGEHVTDHKHGTKRDLKLVKRTVSYADLDKFPEGDESIGKQATVETKEIQ